MKEPRTHSVFQFKKQSFFSFLLSVCITFGLACPLHLILRFTPRPLLIFLVSLAVSAGFMILQSIRPLRLLPYPLLLGVIVLVLFPYRVDMRSFSSAFVLAINGDLLAMAVWSYPLTILLTLIISSIANAISISDSPFFFVLLLLILLFFPIALGTTHLSVLWLLPIVFALLLAGRESSTHYSASLITSLAVMLITILLFPLLPKTQTSLKSNATTIRQTIDDYLFFTDARTPFSLAGTGWQPYGPNRLGGTANPTDDKVMQVLVSKPALLRGTVRDAYDGFSWSDTIGGRRYLFIDPRFLNLRHNLFDLGRPSRSIAASFPESELVRVYIEQDTASTLYLTQRFSNISGKGIVPYFSPASELFATHSLVAGNQYDFHATLVGTDTEGIRDLVLSAASTSDAWMEESILTQYLSLPSIVETNVYALAEEITKNARTDYDRALALTTYLAENYEYSLTQNAPPSDRDFVSWFLFEEKRGYCTAFASSLAVMARAIGLPARYIEGYAAIPDNDGIAYVTQENAHAWCEIYFAGFGWLTFDPTPGPDQDKTGNNDGQQPDASPTPTPTPEPTPTPDDPDNPLPTPTPTPAPSEDPSQSPPPTPIPEITPEPTPVPPEQKDNLSGLFRLLIFIVLLLLLIACVALRLSLTSPATVSERQKDRSNALLVYYAAILQALTCMHIYPNPGEAPASFLVRADALLKNPVNLRRLADALCMAGYSSKQPRKKQLAEAEETYGLVINQMTPVARLRLILMRLLHGLNLKSLA